MDFMVQSRREEYLSSFTVSHITLGAHPNRITMSDSFAIDVTDCERENK